MKDFKLKLSDASEEMLYRLMQEYGTKNIDEFIVNLLHIADSLSREKQMGFSQFWVKNPTSKKEKHLTFPGISYLYDKPK